MRPAIWLLRDSYRFFRGTFMALSPPTGPWPLTRVVIAHKPLVPLNDSEASYLASIAGILNPLPDEAQ